MQGLLELRHIQKGMGKGAAELTDAEILVLIDGDGAYSPSELERLVEPIVEGRADLGSGFRGQVEKPFHG